MSAKNRRKAAKRDKNRHFAHGCPRVPTVAPTNEPLVPTKPTGNRARAYVREKNAKTKNAPRTHATPRFPVGLVGTKAKSVDSAVGNPWA